MTQKQLLHFNVLLLTTLIPFSMRGEGDYGRSELHNAAWKNNIQKAKQLLDNDPDPDKLDVGKNTPLHLAINRGYFPLAELLLNRGANPNAQNIDGNTPLHSAARWNRDDIAQFLLEKGADYNRQNLQNERPSDVARSVESRAVETILNQAQHIDEPMENVTMVFPHDSREATAIMMMLEQAHREEAIATQS